MKFIGFYNYTVILTYLGAAAAICGIFFSADGNPLLGSACLLFAGLTDMFDGKIASTMKRTPDEKNFGIQIDSLCDLLSFGVLPSAIGYGIGLRGFVFYFSAACFFLCAVIRLGYFNVDECSRQRTETGVRKFYYGLPVTTSAIIFPFIFCLKEFFGDAFTVIYQVAIFIVAFLFILKFKINKPHGKALIPFLAAGLIIAALVIFGGFVK